MKNLFKIIVILIFFCIVCIIIYNNGKLDTYKIDKNLIVNYIEKQQVELDDNIGTLKIDKINLSNKLYDINSDKNDVDKNVTILKGSIDPTNDNSIMFIAAHSGYGDKAYFRNLDKLVLNDEIILEYNNMKYKYIVIDKWEEKKDGDIEVNKTKEKQLVLTTCSTKDKNKQLVINCIEKES